MGVLLALALVLLPARLDAAAALPAVSVTISVDRAAAAAAPDARALGAGIQGLFASEYGHFASLSFAGPAQGAPRVTVTVALQGDLLAVTSDFSRGGSVRELVSTVPRGSPAALCAAITGDVAFLVFSDQSFASFPPAAPPGMTAILPTDSLAALLGLKGDEAEPLALSGRASGVTVTFPHGWLGVGPLFQVTAETAIDLGAQAVAREALQLSDAVRADTGEMFLVAQAAARIVVVNPMTGTRTTIPAPGVSAGKAGLVGPRTLADMAGALGSAGIALYTPGAAPAVLPFRGAQVSAFAGDVEGNLWLWDITERRIRIVAANGTEVFSIKPLFKASLMPIPQELEVYPDGSFLLGGSGELWRFENTGIPVWRLTRMPGRTGERLPGSFQVALTGTDGSFVLLDAPSRRLLAFGPGDPGPRAALAGFFARWDPRSVADLQEGAGLAHAAGLTLLAQSLDAQLAARAGPAAPAAADARALLRERLDRGVQLAQERERDLLAARADAAWTRVAETARALAALVPDDTAAAAALTASVSRRQELRAALAPGGSGTAGAVQVTRAELRRTAGSACTTGVELHLRLKNTGTAALTQVRVRAGVPAAGMGPALADAPDLEAGADAALTLLLGPDPGTIGTAGALVSVAGLVSAQSGAAGSTAALLVDAPVVDDPPGASGAAALSCAADPADPLLRALAGDTPGSFAAFVELVDHLLAMRAAVADAIPAAPQGLRTALRTLSPDAQGWTVLLASLAGTEGLGSGFITWSDASLALVQTDITLADAETREPGLAAWSAVLEELSRDGRLCLPVSAAVGNRSAAAAVADGLAVCALRGLQGAAVRWLASGSTPARLPVPVPFPAGFPSSPVSGAARPDFLADVSAALSARAAP
jgi:hypothetical protein